MYALSVALRLLIAVVCGGLVGWQREARDRPAGLRTHVLVCLGATVYTLASLSFTGINADPGRVAAQVATGMGFLGAGTIIRHGNAVRGLTTAASLWGVAAIGLCVGIGGEVFWVAAISTLLVLVTLTALRRVEKTIMTRSRIAQLSLRMVGSVLGTTEVRKVLEANGAEIESVEMSEVGPGKMQEMQLRVILPGTCDIGQLSSELANIEGFISLRCE